MYVCPAARQIKEMLDICREYKNAIRIKNAIAETPAENAVRNIELAAYFTHCNLQVGTCPSSSSPSSPRLNSAAEADSLSVLCSSTARAHGADAAHGHGGGLQVPELHHGRLLRPAAARAQRHGVREERRAPTQGAPPRRSLSGLSDDCLDNTHKHRPH